MIEVYHDELGPSKIVLTAPGGETFEAKVTPNGEDDKLEFVSDIEALSDEILRGAVVEVLGIIRENKLARSLYYKASKANTKLARVLAASGFEAHEFTDSHDYYSPISQIPEEIRADLGMVDYAPELVSLLESLHIKKDGVEQYYEETDLLGDDNFFVSYDLSYGKNFEDMGQATYWIRLCRQMELLTIAGQYVAPCEQIDVKLDPDTGKILSYDIKMLYEKPNGTNIPLSKTGNSPSVSEEGVQLINRGGKKYLEENVNNWLSQEKLIEILEILESAVAIKDETFGT